MSSSASHPLPRPASRAASEPQPRFEDALNGIPSDILKAAVARVEGRWRQEASDAVESDQVGDLLVLIATAAFERRGTAAGPIDERARCPLGRRVLELLRAEVVHEWSSDAAPTDEIRRIMVGLERVREAIEPDWAQYFVSRLSGPDGLELLVDVAHDLRSPLTSILFLAETLQLGRSGDVNDMQRRQLGLIYSAALGLSSVASDIIELVRGGDRLVEREPVPFSVTEVLESVRDIVRPIAEEKQLTVRLGLPESDQRLGHPLALSRVLLNLTTNALKFTDQGYVEVRTREVEEGRVEFSVRDTGKGIDPSIVRTLYAAPLGGSGRRGNSFSQTGLGLAMCRKLAEAMGSELLVETRPGWGTRFFFELELPPSTPMRPPRQGGGSTRHGRRKRDERSAGAPAATRPQR